MKQNALTSYSRRYPSLRVFSDALQTRLCYPIAPDQIVFQNSSSTRPIGELLDIVEGTFGGKFHLPVETAPEKALEPATEDNSENSRRKPLATIEIWSLEQGAYDLVLRLPNTIAENDTLCTPLIGRFVDQAREVTRLIDNIDLLRYHSGPALGAKDAHNRLQLIERDHGTRLNSEDLFALLQGPLQKSMQNHLKKSLN